MFENQHFDHMRGLFAGQFEPHGNDFLYRKNMKAAPILVNTAERDKYIATYDKFIRYGFRVTIIFTVTALVSIAGYATATDSPVSDIAIYVSFGVVAAIFVTGHRWAYGLPARELRGRGAIGEARSGADVRQALLARTTYGQLAAIAVATVFALAQINAREDLTLGWNRLWLVAGALTIISVGIQAVRKWRFDRSNKD